MQNRTFVDVTGSALTPGAEVVLGPKAGWWGRGFRRSSPAVIDGTVLGAADVRLVNDAAALEGVPSVPGTTTPVYLGDGAEPALTPWMVERLAEAAYKIDGGENFAAYALDCGPEHLEQLVDGALSMAAVPLSSLAMRERAILITYRILRDLGFA